MKTRFLAAALILAMLLMLAACGSAASDAEEETVRSTEEVETEVETEPEAAVPETVEAEPAEAVAEPAAEPEPEAEPAKLIGSWECTAIDLFGSGTYYTDEEFQDYFGMSVKDYIAIQAWDNGCGVILMASMDDMYDEDEDAASEMEGLPFRWAENDGSYEVSAYEGTTDEKFSCSFTEDDQLEFKIISEYTSEEDGKTVTLESYMAMLFTRTGDPDSSSIYSINFYPSSEETQKMSASMHSGLYLMDGNTVYGYYNGDKLAQVEIKVESGAPVKVSETVLKEDISYSYLNKQGDLLYYINTGDEEGIWSYNLTTGEEKQLISGSVDYLTVTEQYLFYTDADYRICRADLNGENAEKVCEDEAYYVYPITDNFLLYQDDADNETLVIYNISTQEKFAVSPEHTHLPVINGGYLYYTVNVDGEFYLCRTNMYTGEIEEGDYALSFAFFFISGDKIYFNDGFSVYIENWDHISENLPSAWMSTNYCWADDDWWIEEGFAAYNLYAVDGSGEYLAMMTEEDWNELLKSQE